MTRIHRSILAATLIFAAPQISHAGSMRCGGNIISPGITQQELLEACGQPVSRRGGDWLYKKRGSISMVVTISGGIVTFIRDEDESDAFGHPYGDRP